MRAGQAVRESNIRRAAPTGNAILKYGRVLKSPWSCAYLMSQVYPVNLNLERTNFAYFAGGFGQKRAQDDSGARPLPAVAWL